LANRQFGAAGPHSGIVLITAGGDKIGQSGAKYTRQQVLEGYYKRRIPVHIVAVGASSGTKDANWSDLQLIARRSQGSFQPVTSSSDLQDAVKLAVNAIVQGDELPGSVDIPRQAESLPRPAMATPIGDTRSSGPPRNAVVEGVVLYYGRPLPKARVTIEGLAAPAAVADSTGEFRFNNVPPGRYEVHVIGSAHHQPYSGKSTLIVPESGDEPLFMEFDLN
ncbi:MAG: carboxypeptidase-like regulatory domain-containing protein, partial [Planctomycetia bacterium]|nr:carboxypeptidase-like regulatory domain-containing protein [Planctomycetia bacterium]